MKFEGGIVKRVAPRVVTPTKLDPNYSVQEPTKLEKVIDEAFKERDRIVGELLDLDNKYDIVQNAIKDQLKGMNIPVTNRATREAVQAFGGNNTITPEIYEKAKVVKNAITTLLGVNPLHVPFAKNTPYGKALTQYAGDINKDCASILLGFPNKKLFTKETTMPFGVDKTSDALANDGIGAAGTNPDEGILTLMVDMMNKIAIDMVNFLQYKLFWDIIYHKFLKVIILFNPKIWATVMKPWAMKKWIKPLTLIGKYFTKIYCLIVKFIYFFENIPGILGIRPPPIGGYIGVQKQYGVTADVQFGPTDKNGQATKYVDKNGQGTNDTITTTKEMESAPFKDEQINYTVRQMEDCTTKEEMTRTEKWRKTEKEIEKKEENLANTMADCRLKMNSVFDPPPEPDPDEPEQKESCADGEVRLLTNNLVAAMGMGIDDKSPFQEGFIPPQCYAYAQKILDAINNDTLYGNPNNDYNSSALLLDGIVSEMRDFQEMSKFMVTIQDDSPGSKALMENTANIPKYNDIYNNKDVQDFRKTIFS